MDRRGAIFLKHGVDPHMAKTKPSTTAVYTIVSRPNAHPDANDQPADSHYTHQQLQ